MFNVFVSTRINHQETSKGIYFKLKLLAVRQMKIHFKRIHCKDKMAQAIIAQKSSKVDTDLQKISMDNDVQGNKRRKTENWLYQGFSQDDSDIKKKKAAARGLARKRYCTTRIKARNFLANIAYRRYKKSDFNNGNFVIDV